MLLGQPGQEEQIKLLKQIVIFIWYTPIQNLPISINLL